jgi:hypothetical protein
MQHIIPPAFAYRQLFTERPDGDPLVDLAVMQSEIARWIEILTRLEAFAYRYDWMKAGAQVQVARMALGHLAYNVLRQMGDWLEEQAPQDELTWL